ncbi:MAG: hypothetical protein C0593_05205 [Marinilabiliales bacterium]|nr:MAG: hypothetical protein C0593_05205 [Marinilabiliales bacterium]
MKGKLEQGKYYDFKVIKSVSLEEGGRFWILEDPFGFRQMLNAEFYTHYPIEPGMTMHCKVDKINCSGKIFLEPPNPQYRKGEIFRFSVLSFEQFNDRFIVHVTDAFNDVHTLVLSAKPVEYVNCRVDRIKKGKLYLSDPETEVSKWFAEGENYPFFIEDIKTTPECGECFFLKDVNARSHILPVKNYLHYNFKQGDTIQCTVVKQNESGRCTLEPIHPNYVPGNQYLFKLISIEYTESFNDRNEWVLFVTDIYNNSIMVIPDCREPLKEFEGCSMVLCEVERVKKGKVFLVNPEPVNTP